MTPGRLLRLTTREVCDLARISRATLWRRVSTGRIPQPVDRGQEALFDTEQVLHALRPVRGAAGGLTPSAVDQVVRERIEALARRRFNSG